MSDEVLGLQILAAVVPSVAIIVYLLQLRAMRLATESQNVLTLFKFIQKEHIRQARHAVITEIDEKKEWTDVEKKQISLVCSSYDIAGIVLRLGYVKPKAFLENYGPSIVKCYPKCKPYIEHCRQQFDSRYAQRYWDDFTWLYKMVTTRKTSLSMEDRLRNVYKALTERHPDSL